MRISHQIKRYIALATALGLASTAGAAALCISNACFQIPVLTTVGEEASSPLQVWDGTTNWPIPGWVAYSPSYPWEWFIGYPDPVSLPAGGHAGLNVLVAMAYDPATSYVQQTLTNTLQPNTQYTLSAWAANPDSSSLAYNSLEILLYAGGTLLGGGNIQPVTTNVWKTGSFVYHSGNSDPALGQPLVIRLTWGNGQGNYRMFVDDVALDATTLATNVPSAPTNLTATAFGAAAIDLAWSNGGGTADGFQVARSSGASGFQMIASVCANATTFRDHFLSSGTTYSYQVRAFNSLGNSPAASVSAATASLAGAAISGPVYVNTADYGYTWMSNAAVNGIDSSVYFIKTSRYAMSFDTVKVGPTALFPLTNPSAESAVLTESAAASFPPAAPIRFSCNLVADGLTNIVTPSPNGISDVQLVECGKFFQRRWQKLSVAGNLLADSNLSGLEVAAWPDRISFVLRVTPTNTVANGTLEMTFGLTNAFNTPLSYGGGFALQSADGAGYVFLKSAGSSSLSVDSTNAVVTVHTAVSNWTSNQEASVGLIIYPAPANVAAVLTNAVATESAPLALNATGTFPASGTLPVSYDADRGWYDVIVPANGTAGDNGFLRVRVAMSNNTTSPRVMRINFDGTPFYIPGITAVLRDVNENPMGIPVQLSKNWAGPYPPPPPPNFAGWWFHGLTMLTVPANTNLSFELVMAGENWGGVPAATHSQLCLIGYGGNQQWDQSALGNFGEALTYDPEHGLTDNDCCDSRPLLVTDDQGHIDAWGGNVGGASFLRYFDRGGNERLHVRMRTQYVRYCPNLTYAIYAGQTDDGSMEFSDSASLCRSDDYTRGWHHLRVHVTSATAFSRLAFFQQAADTYAANNGNTLAYGDAGTPTPLRLWPATFGLNQDVGTPVALTGPSPWIMTLNCPTESPYSAANRGFVIRSWHARIQGTDTVPPYIVERSITGGSIIDVVPPPGVTTLQAGDYVDAWIERFYVPEFATNYYGPNTSFHTALTNYPNGYQIGLREAAGNNLSAAAQWGGLRQAYPIQIESTNNRAGFAITGGLGYVPVTFTGLSDYRAPVLEQWTGGSWTQVNQAMNGNDYWQCDYNAERGSWEISFNVKMDGTNYVDLNALMNTPQTNTFRFRLGAALLPDILNVALSNGGHLALTITGEPGSRFFLLASADLALPPLNWATVTNGTIAATPFTLTIPMATNAPQQFFRLQTL